MPAKRTGLPRVPGELRMPLFRNVTMSADRWPSIAVVGAGAVGCYFGGMLAKAGAPVTLIGRAHHMEAIARDGLFLETLQFQQRIPVRTSTELKAAGDSQIVLFCLKTIDTERVAQALKPHLAPGAIVVSLQNGVDNVERIYAAAQIRAVPAVVYVATAMAAPGQVKHSGRGDLIIGGAEPSELKMVAETFERAGVPCPISQNIKADLWTKMLMNCAYNAVSALSRERYGRIVQFQPARDLMARVIEEAIAVAGAEGVSLPARAMIDATFKLGEVMMSGARSSTSQDISRSKPTEIDSLNGYVVRKGREFGIPTPVNETLWTLVKLLEGSVREAARAAID
jgi:2-dehydropantoate 2-reductase